MLTTVLGAILLFIWFGAMPNWRQTKTVRASLQRAGQYRGIAPARPDTLS